MTMNNLNDGEWYPWSAGVKPEAVHDMSLVEAVWHDPKNNRVGVTGPLYAGHCQGAGMRVAWSQVVKFRVVKVHREPREFWLHVDTGFWTSAPTRDRKYMIRVREVVDE